MSAVAETLAIFAGVDTLALPVLIYCGKVVTPGRPRRAPAPKTTVEAVGHEPAVSAASNGNNYTPYPLMSLAPVASATPVPVGSGRRGERGRFVPDPNSKRQRRLRGEVA